MYCSSCNGIRDDVSRTISAIKNVSCVFASFFIGMICFGFRFRCAMYFGYPSRGFVFQTIQATSVDIASYRTRIVNIGRISFSKISLVVLERLEQRHLQQLSQNDESRRGLLFLLLFFLQQGKPNQFLLYLIF